MEILIDGYNLIFKSPELKKLFLKDPGTCFDCLTGQLITLQKKHPHLTICLVLDEPKKRPLAPGTAGYPEIKRLELGRGIRMQYAPSADAFIINRCRTLKKQCLVVSSDLKDIYKPAHALGRLRLKSEEFLMILAKARKTRRKNVDLDKPLPESEIQYWLEFFKPEKRGSYGK